MGFLNIEFLEEKYMSLGAIFSEDKENSDRYQCHGLFPYPAMMVPQLQGMLIKELLGEGAERKTVFDPFMGSGTVLSEALSCGADFYGTDINPLSILCCKVKSDYFNIESAMEGLSTLKMTIATEKLSLEDLIQFPKVEKWFSNEVLIALSKIRKCIQLSPVMWFRRICWLCLSESVRKFSNTRMSTYKLHIDKNQKRYEEKDVFGHFVKVCERNIRLKAEAWEVHSKSGLIIRGNPRSNVHLELSDVRCMNGSFEADVLVTSPPYGDNQTTVTYGQFSYLPLQFLDPNDIGCPFDLSLINNASAIDSASLGGSLRYWQDKLECVANHSKTLSVVAGELKKIGRGGEKRLASFGFDLHESLVSISQRVIVGGHAMVTLGNRNINGLNIPLDSIVKEFLQSLGFETQGILDRRISNKRMAGSMSSEKILLMRKSR